MSTVKLGMVSLSLACCGRGRGSDGTTPTSEIVVSTVYCCYIEVTTPGLTALTEVGRRRHIDCTQYCKYASLCLGLIIKCRLNALCAVNGTVSYMPEKATLVATPPPPARDSESRRISRTPHTPFNFPFWPSRQSPA